MWQHTLPGFWRTSDGSEFSLAVCAHHANMVLGKIQNAKKEGKKVSNEGPASNTARTPQQNRDSKLYRWRRLLKHFEMTIQFLIWNKSGPRLCGPVSIRASTFQYRGPACYIRFTSVQFINPRKDKDNCESFRSVKPDRAHFLSFERCL